MTQIVMAQTDTRNTGNRDEYVKLTFASPEPPLAIHFLLEPTREEHSAWPQSIQLHAALCLSGVPVVIEDGTGVVLTCGEAVENVISDIY